MNRFPVVLAWWEGRRSFSRIGVYMLSISLGVMALVSVRSFRNDVARSIRTEAQVLMGADVRVGGRRALPDSLESVMDSLRSAGVRVAEVVTAPTMVLASRSGAVRLLQVRAVDGAWPFYGEVTTDPPGAWGQVPEDAVLVDPAALTQLAAVPGDTLVVGGLPFVIRGTVRDSPTDLGFQTAVGPRVYLSPEALEATGILGFGSLARHERYLELPDPYDQALVETRYLEWLQADGIQYETAEQQARDLTRGVGYLSDFLGLVGLGALLLGGIGVGSAIHVFVRERITDVAVLRCLGAGQGPVFLTFLLQAGGMGFLGAALGAVAGVGVQYLLPSLLSGVLPVAVTPRLSPGSILGGLGVGVWIAVVFALLPLLDVRRIPPLRAFRAGFEAEGVEGRDPWRWVAIGALGASVTALSILEAPGPGEGMAFAVALAFTTLLLWLTGRGVVALARRFFPAGAPYPVRQGFSNLFRPQNQTVAVTLALGFGAFIVGTVVQVRGNLVRELSLDVQQGQPNLLLFDVQGDQREEVLELMGDEMRRDTEVTAITPARLTAVRGIERDSLSRLASGERPERWAVRREYRHTSRSELTDAEELVAGAWWPEAPRAEAGVARVSVEEGLADELAVAVGDRLTWEIGGVEVPSVITSLRRVDWSRFQTNFFVVFEPGSLEGAPTTYVMLSRTPDEASSADFQRGLVQAFPNVSVLDIGRIQEVVGAILSSVTQAVGFLAAFASVAGLLVLAGALASSRHQRLQEGALLRTLGARRPQVLTVLFSEYLALGALAALTGLVLSWVASGLMVALVFDIPFRPEWGATLAIWLAISGVTLVTGLLGSRDLLGRPPLPVLRES